MHTVSYTNLPWEDLSSGVSGVDNDDSFGHAGLQRLLVRPLKLVHLQRPVAFLVQVVADLENNNWVVKGI